MDNEDHGGAPAQLIHDLSKALGRLAVEAACDLTEEREPTMPVTPSSVSKK